MSVVGTSRLTAANSSDDAPFWILRHHSPASITALAFLKGTRSRSSRRRTSSASSSSSASETSSTSSDEDFELSSSSSSAPRQSILPEGSRYLLIGDADGKVSLVDLASYRAVAHWQAHKAGTSILGVEDWPYEEIDQTDRRRGRRSRGQVRVVTHGRDNTLKVWSLALPSTSALGKAREAPLAEPRLLHALQVNALNFCRFSLLPGEAGKGKSRDTGDAGVQAAKVSMDEGEGEALLAVPHTLDSGYIDIYHLPSYARVHTSIGSSSSANAQRKVGGVTRAPIVMAMHLFRLHVQRAPGEGESERGRLALLAGYEDGSLVLWTHASDDKIKAKDVNGQWKESWRAKAHRESVLTLSILPSTSNPGSRSGPGIYFLSAGVDDRVVLGCVALSGESAEASTASDAASKISARILHTYTTPNARGGKAASAFLPLSLRTGLQRQREGEGEGDEEGEEEGEVRFVLGAWDGRGKEYSYTHPLSPNLESSSPSSSSSPREGEGGGGSIACTRTLRYHKEGVQAVACAPLASTGAGYARERDALIALGGKEGRVTLWRG